VRPEALDIFRVLVAVLQNFMEIIAENAFYRVISEFSVGSKRCLGIY
jgi:hypothetical protein